MARRIRKGAVAAFLVDLGHPYSEPAAADWDPGFRVAQNGPRSVYVYWDGVGESDQLDTITEQLRGAEDGYHAVATQQERGGRRRLEVTLP